MKVIALSGWKKSGKDTVADYICNNYPFVKYTFADDMKDLVCETYCLRNEQLTDQSLKEEPLLEYPVEPLDSFNEGIHALLKDEFREHQGVRYWTPRALLILEGSVKRSVSNTYWTENLFARIKSMHDDPYIVISDLRFKAEYEALEREFGDNLITVRINRFDSVNTSDPSERNLDNTDFDVFIENKGNLEDLYKDVDRLMELEDIKKNS